MTWRDEVIRASAHVVRCSLTLAQVEAIGSSWEYSRPTRILELTVPPGSETCYLAVMAASYGGHVTVLDVHCHGATDGQSPARDEALQRRYDNVRIEQPAGGLAGFWREQFTGDAAPWDFISMNDIHEWGTITAQSFAALAALRVGGWLCLHAVDDPAHPDVGLVWRSVIRPFFPNTYERDGLGFVARHV